MERGNMVESKARGEINSVGGNNKIRLRKCTEKKKFQQVEIFSGTISKLIVGNTQNERKQGKYSLQDRRIMAEERHWR